LINVQSCEVGVVDPEGMLALYLTNKELMFCEAKT